jgi:hypothetical protein
MRRGDALANAREKVRAASCPAALVDRPKVALLRDLDCRQLGTDLRVDLRLGHDLLRQLSEPSNSVGNPAGLTAMF